MDDMMMARRTAGPEGLAVTFAELARMAVRGADLVDVYTLLSERVVTLLPVAACGILVRDAGGTLHVVGSSSASAHLLDLFQVQNDEGPCLECLTSGRPVSVDLADASARWPRFSALLEIEGFSAAYALPIASRAVTVGALNLFARDGLGAAELEVAQALADVAALALLQSDAVEDAVVVARRLYVAVQARSTVSQAIGVLMERLGLDADDALRRLRMTAATHGEALVGLAAAVVARDVRSVGAGTLLRKA
jgi:GAF domain-containing protein